MPWGRDLRGRVCRHVTAWRAGRRRHVRVTVSSVTVLYMTCACTVCEGPRLAGDANLGVLPLPTVSLHRVRSASPAALHTRAWSRGPMTIFHMAAPKSAAPFAPPYHALTSSPFQGASAQHMGVSNVMVLKPSAVSARRDDRALPPALGGAPRGMLSPRMPFAHEQLVPLVLPPAEQARLVVGRGDKAPPMRRPPSFSSGVLTEQIRVGEPLRESASTPPVHPPAHHHVKRSPRASTPRGFGRNAPMRHLQQPLPMSSQGTKPYHAKLVGKHIELPPAPPASPASQRPATAAAVTAGRPPIPISAEIARTYRQAGLVGRHERAARRCHSATDPPLLLQQPPYNATKSH